MSRWDPDPGVVQNVNGNKICETGAGNTSELNDPWLGCTPFWDVPGLFHSEWEQPRGIAVKACLVFKAVQRREYYDLEPLRRGRRVSLPRARRLHGVDVHAGHSPRSGGLRGLPPGRLGLRVVHFGPIRDRLVRLETTFHAERTAPGLS